MPSLVLALTAAQDLNGVEPLDCRYVRPPPVADRVVPRVNIRVRAYNDLTTQVISSAVR